MRRSLQCLVVAVLSSFAVGRAQDADLRSKINDALDMARPALLGHLQAANRSTRAGALALLVLAAIHDGVDRNDPILDKAIERLAKAKPNQTYDIALRLIVLEACPTFPDRDQLAKRDTKLLLDHRCKEGAFQYTRKPSTWDLSNTQYGALGLRAAASLGLKIRSRVWEDLAREISRHQDEKGGFSYTSHRNIKYATASMTAAGIAVLAICRQALGDNHKLADKLDRQIEHGWQWFAAHDGVIGSVEQPWCYYFHYGLERAAILCDVDKIDGRIDWYSEGARMLVAEQLAGGGWRSLKDGFPGGHLSRKRGDSVPTAFAILFLRRMFRKEIGPITDYIVRLVNIGPMSKQGDVDRCAELLAKKGKEAMKEVLRAMRSEVRQQRQVALQALDAITGDHFGFDPEADRDGNRKAVRSAELWYLRNR